MGKFKKKLLEKDKGMIQGSLIYFFRKKYGWSLGALSRKTDFSYNIYQISKMVER